jgi:hypothetical protein
MAFNRVPHWHARDTTPPPSRLAPRRTLLEELRQTQSILWYTKHQGVTRNLSVLFHSIRFLLPSTIPFVSIYPFHSFPSTHSIQPVHLNYSIWSIHSNHSRLSTAAAASLSHPGIRGNVGVLVVVLP